MRILPKILVICGLFGALAASLLLGGLQSLSTMKASLDGIADDQFVSLKLAALAQEKSTRRHQLAFEILSESSPADLDNLQKEFLSETAALQDLLDRFATFADGPDAERFKALAATEDAYTQAEMSLFAMKTSGRREDAEVLAQDRMTTLFDTADEIFDALVKQQDDDANAAQVEADRLENATATTLIACALTALAAIALIAAWIARSQIVLPIQKLQSAMRDLASGKLDIPVDGQERGDEVGGMARAVQVFKDAAIESRRLDAEATAARDAQAQSRDRQAAIDNAKAEDLKTFVHAVDEGFEKLVAGDLTARMKKTVAPEFEPIRARFNESVASLEVTLGAVVSAVGTIRVGLGQITVAASDLSQRTEQQAASLEETVAALSEVTRGVNDTAANASQAQTNAQATQQIAEEGGGIVSRAVEAMGEIERSSAEIGKIIGVIDEIAFQTNLLALNAGVEAARAGEAGRGFAVVAQEVRGLAQRSAEAAKEIKDLISTSSAQVDEGVKLVSASGRSLNDIVAGVGNLVKVVATIAHSAREQASSLREVSTAADQMDKVTQQNAAMVEETTAAAQSLSQETQQLAGLTERFRTGGVSSPSRGTPPVQPRSAAQLRTVGGGGAAPKPRTDEWAEF